MGAAESVVEDPRTQFRVRFTRARGLAALFERPDNTYQWSGYGTVRVDLRGVQFRATRRRMGLPRTEARFVAGREISNVYREGDGVRVEFREHTRQNVLNFWAEDAAAAANIVEQLPTIRTVEVEERPPGAARPTKRTLRTELLLVALAVCVALAGVVWVAPHAIGWIAGHAPNRAPAPMVSWTPSPVAAVIESNVISTPAISAAELSVVQQDFARFASRSGVLRAQFDSAFKALLDGSLSQHDFADGAERWLIPQWVSLEKMLRETPYENGSSREAFRLTLLDVTHDWRTGLESYAHGLREQDAHQVRRAFGYIGTAEETESVVRESVTR